MRRVGAAHLLLDEVRVQLYLVDGRDDIGPLHEFGEVFGVVVAYADGPDSTFAE